MMRLQIRMFVRQWTLAISMIVGISSYLFLSWLPLGNEVRGFMLHGVAVLQPILIFLMLFLTFCRIQPSQLRLCRWQIWNLLLQTGMFSCLCLLLVLFPHTSFRVAIEGALLCFICPTATAAVVVTSKLGGCAGTTTTYTLLINLCVAILVPLLVPVIHPQEDMNFSHAFCVVLSKVFPLLLCPIMAAEVLRKISPNLTSRLASYKDLPFRLWAIALALALAVTTRSLANSHVSFYMAGGIALASLLACIIQFGIGRIAGLKYGDAISAAQSCGQKNTVFAIWMGYTFLTPITVLAGGFYSIWHNVYNSWQLAQMKRKETDEGRHSTHSGEESHQNDCTNDIHHQR
ncbi:MAG: transporter [Bacteroidaceae bacterium]